MWLVGGLISRNARRPASRGSIRLGRWAGIDVEGRPTKILHLCVPVPAVPAVPMQSIDGEMA